jgi:hypothetical protein
MRYPINIENGGAVGRSHAGAEEPCEPSQGVADAVEQGVILMVKKWGRSNPRGRYPRHLRSRYPKSTRIPRLHGLITPIHLPE